MALQPVSPRPRIHQSFSREQNYSFSHFNLIVDIDRIFTWMWEIWIFHALELCMLLFFSYFCFKDVPEQTASSFSFQKIYGVGNTDHWSSSYTPPRFFLGALSLNGDLLFKLCPKFSWDLPWILKCFSPFIQALSSTFDLVAWFGPPPNISLDAPVTMSLWSSEWDSRLCRFSVQKCKYIFLLYYIKCFLYPKFLGSRNIMP